MQTYTHTNRNSSKPQNRHKNIKAKKSKGQKNEPQKPTEAKRLQKY